MSMEEIYKLIILAKSHLQQEVVDMETKVGMEAKVVMEAKVEIEADTVVVVVEINTLPL